MQLILAELVPARLRRTVSAFDMQSRGYGSFRALLALAQLTILSITPYEALMQTLAGERAGPNCAGVRAASAYCLGRNLPEWFVTASMACVLVMAAAGVLPVVISVLHSWVAFSIASSIALPDGGDQAAAVCSILLIGVSIGDRRRWSFGPRRSVVSWRRQIALASLMVLRVQIAAIYFNAAIAKLFAPDWMNGTAEFYVLRDPFFGASGFIGSLLRWATMSPLVTVAATWGAVLTEIVIGTLILCGPRSRSIALVLCIALHGAIIITIGLWSFGLIMIALVGVAAMPYTSHEWERTVWARQSLPTPWHRERRVKGGDA